MLVTQSEFAKAVGLSKGRVSQLVKEKVLTLTKNLKLDLDKAKAEYAAFLGEGSKGTGNQQDAQLQELITLKLENQRARLELQQAAIELAKLKSDIARGNLVSAESTALLYSQTLWRLFQEMEAIPLQTLHLICRDRDQIATVDQIYRDTVQSAFHAAISDSAIRERLAHVAKKCDILIELCETEAQMLKHRPCADPETFETLRAFAGDIRAMFAGMKPDTFRFDVPGKEANR